MRTLTQQLDRRSCKTALRGIADPPRSSSSVPPPRLYRHGSLVLLSLILVVSPLVRHECVLSQYLRPSSSSFILSGRVGGIRGLRGHLCWSITLSISIFFFLLVRLPPPKPTIHPSHSDFCTIVSDQRDTARSWEKVDNFTMIWRALKSNVVSVTETRDRAETPEKARFYQRLHRKAIK